MSTYSSRNYGNFPVDKRHDDGFADKVFVTLVVGVYRHSRVAQHCFGTCCGKRYGSFAVLCGVSVMPEKSVLFGVFHLGVGQCRLTVRTPVDYSVATVDKTSLYILTNA